MNLRTLADLGDVAGKTILLRADFNVPVSKGEVTSNYRIKQTVKTLQYLIKSKARVVIISHLGRPQGEYNDEYSLMPVRFELGKLLDMHIKFAHIDSCKNSITFMEDGEVLMLENARFFPGEESSKPAVRKKFIAELAELADGYVNEAFGVYGQHASILELPKAIKNPVAGELIHTEVQKLTQLRENVEAPYVAVIGGAKLDSKIPILEHLVETADAILIGGAMAYTFLKAKGIGVGKSLVQDDLLKTAERIMKKAEKSKCKFLLPVDHIAAEEFAEDAKAMKVDTQQIPDNLFGMDIGERTMSDYQEVIENAKTILWNGPMGVFEWEQFARGTEAVGEYIGLSAPRDTFKVAGGGDTIAAMEQRKINFKNYNHVSTGGGAMLNFLAGEEFPTLKLLEK